MMITSQKTIRKTVLKLSMAAIASASLGAAVLAAPHLSSTTFHAAALQPMASGPALQLAKAGPGDREDCVRVTHITGPDGKDYPTFGMVCR